MTAPTDTRKAAEAFRRLAATNPREFHRIYQQVQRLVGKADQILDSKDRPLEVDDRVKTLDGELGTVKRLDQTSKRAVVALDDGTERMVTAHRLTLTRSRASAAA